MVTLRRSNTTSKPEVEPRDWPKRADFETASVLEAELKARVQGEVKFDRVYRMLYATDASNYQIDPVGVVIPRSQDDVIGAMSLAGWALAHAGAALQLAPTVALGMLFLGALPSTVQSATAYSSLAGGNVALSVVVAAFLNILGVFISAPLFSLLAGSENAAFDLAALERIALILLLPFVLGQLAQGRAGHLVRDHRRLATWMDRLAIAIAVYVAFSGAVEQGLWQLVGPSDWAALLLLVGLFLAIGFGGAWLLGGALRLARGDRIAFLFAGGQKSIALGAPLAAVLFPPPVAGLLLLPVLSYHLLQLVISAPLAARLNRPVGPSR